MTEFCPADPLPTFPSSQDNRCLHQPSRYRLHPCNKWRLHFISFIFRIRHLLWVLALGIGVESGNESSVSGIGDRRHGACSMKIGVALLCFWFAFSSYILSDSRQSRIFILIICLRHFTLLSPPLPPSFSSKRYSLCFCDTSLSCCNALWHFLLMPSLGYPQDVHLRRAS